MPSNLQLPDLLTPGSTAYLRKKQLLAGIPQEPSPPQQQAQAPYRPPTTQAPPIQADSPAPLGSKALAPPAAGTPVLAPPPSIAKPAPGTIGSQPQQAQPPTAGMPATPVPPPTAKPEAPAPAPAAQPGNPSTTPTPPPGTPAQPPQTAVKPPQPVDPAEAARQANAAKANAAQLTAASQAGAVIDKDQLIPHPDGKGGVLHHVGFVSISDPKAPDKAPAIVYRDDPDKGVSIPYRDNHGRQRPIPVQDIRRVKDPSGQVNYHFMVDGRPVSIPEDSKAPLFQVAPDGRRFITTADGTRRDLGYDPNAAAQAGVVPREAAARTSLDAKLAQSTDITRQLTEKQSTARRTPFVTSAPKPSKA